MIDSGHGALWQNDIVGREGGKQEGEWECLFSLIIRKKNPSKL
jgi:hypothetical protein